MSSNKKSPKSDFNQAQNLLRASYLLVTALSILAWNSFFKGSLTGFSVPSLLAILAFGYMWLHYLSGYLKSSLKMQLDTRLSLKISQVFVLLAIVAHPIAIASRLSESGYGSPPSSFEKAFPGKTIFIALGTVSLIAFLTFEFKKILAKKPAIWELVLKLNDLAMLLIILHGFGLGLVVNSTWFRFVWLLYGLSLLYFYYNTYIVQGKLKRYTTPFIIALLLLGIGFIALTAQAGISKANKAYSATGQSNQQQEDQEGWISIVQLSKNDGLEGRPCWVAVDGDVYDVSKSSEWKNGSHIPSNGQAKCGQDLTQAIASSPHGMNPLGRFPIVGQLRSEKSKI